MTLAAPGRILVLRMTLAVAAALLGAGLLTLGTARGIARSWAADRQRESAETLLEVLTPSATAACFVGDRDLGEQIVQGLVASRGIRSATLSSEGTVLASAQQPAAPGAQNAARPPAVSRKLWSPFNPEAQVGELVLNLTPGDPEGSGWRAAALWLGGLLTLTLVLALALALVLQLLIILPLRTLSGWIQGLETGTSQSLKAPLGHAQDELGQLTQALNGLLAHFREALSSERRLSASLAKEKRRIQGILDHSGAGIFVLRGDGTLDTWTPAFHHLLGMEHAQPSRGDHLPELFGTGAPEVAQCLSQCLAEATPTSEVFRIRERNGAPSHRWLRLTLNPVGPDWFQGLLEDLTPMLAVTHAAAEIPIREPLTGLLNRLGAERAITEHLSNGTGGLGVLLVGLEPQAPGGTPLNPTSEAQALREGVRRLQLPLFSAGNLARLGDREFLVLLPPPIDRSGALELAQQLLALLGEPIRLAGGGQLHLSASVGIALLDPDEEPSRTVLLERANRALQQARAEGSSGCHLA